MTQENWPAGRSGPLWGMPKEHVRAILNGMDGMRVKIRYSLNGMLNQQASIDGILHSRSTDRSILHVERELRGPADTVKRFSAVLYSRIIDVTSNADALIFSSPVPQELNNFICKYCRGVYNYPRTATPVHCGHCGCCPPNTRPT